MQFGLCLPNFPFGVRPSRDAIVEIAQAAEEAGFTSVWATDHILVPRDKPRYGILHEVFTTLAYVGALTSKVNLGTSVLIAAQRDAILVAKQAATVDDLTNGRMIVGVGAGWIQGEFNFLNADFHRRGKRLDESLRVMKALWTQADPAFEGQFYRFSDVLFEPSPASRGGIPIWVGGNSDIALRRAAALGDATHFDDFTAAQVAEAHGKLRELTQASGRSVAISCRRTVDARPGASPSGIFGGSVDAMRASLAEYAAAGLDHFICQYEHASQAEHIAQIRLFGREFVPQFKA